MISERTPEGVSVFAIVNGYLEQRLYIGYTLREAERQFKREFRRAKEGGD